MAFSPEQSNGSFMANPDIKDKPLSPLGNILETARKIAIKKGHPAVASDDLLQAAISSPDKEAFDWLKSKGIEDPSKISKEGKNRKRSDMESPLKETLITTPSADRIINNAAKKAKGEPHSLHIVQAILNGDSLAAGILRNAGI